MRDAVEGRLGLRQAGESQADALVRGTITRYEPDLPVAYTGDDQDRGHGHPAAGADHGRRSRSWTSAPDKTLWERSGLTLDGDYDPGRELEGRREGLREAGDQHRRGGAVAMVSRRRRAAAAPARSAASSRSRCSPPRSITASTSARCTSATTGCSTRCGPGAAARRAHRRRPSGRGSSTRADRCSAGRPTLPSIRRGGRPSGSPSRPSTAKASICRSSITPSSSSPTQCRSANADC